MIFSRIAWTLRGMLFRLWVNIFGGHVGKGILVHKGVHLRSLPHGGITIGASTYLGRGVVIDVPRTARLTIGQNVHINHYTVLSSGKEVTIGNDAQLGEMCSVRDSDHGMRPNELIRRQNLESSFVHIGQDAWIGRGSAILRNSRIGDGAIVGANSLVRGPVEAFTINVGSPVRKIGNRNQADVSE